MSRTPLVFFALLLLTLPANAEEEVTDDPWQPERAVHLTGNHGLTGFGNMVDGRIPSPLLINPDPELPGGAWSARLTTRGAYADHSRRLHGQAANYSLRERHTSLVAQHGLTVRGLDLSVSLPYTWEHDRLRIGGAPDPPGQREEALGDVLVGAKLGLRIPKFIFGEWAIAGVGLYALGRVPTHTSVSDVAEVEYGMAVTGPYGYSYRYNGNLAILHSEGGVKAIVFRAGGSAVPLANSVVTVRGYAYLSGLQHEGTHRPRLDVEAGAQVFLLEHFSLEIGASFRVLEDEFVEPSLRRAMRSGLGERIRGVRDEGSFAITFGVGVIL